MGAFFCPQDDTYSYSPLPPCPTVPAIQKLMIEMLVNPPPRGVWRTISLDMGVYLGLIGHKHQGFRHRGPPTAGADHKAQPAMLERAPTVPEVVFESPPNPPETQPKFQIQPHVIEAICQATEQTLVQLSELGGAVDALPSMVNRDRQAELVHGI